MSFEGTNGSSLDSIMRDVKELLVPVNHTLFTQVNQGSQVFDGFQSAYVKRPSSNIRRGTLDLSCLEVLS